jgi:hypothetical protein
LATWRGTFLVNSRCPLLTQEVSAIMPEPIVLLSTERFDPT